MFPKLTRLVTFPFCGCSLRQVPGLGVILRYALTRRVQLRKILFGSFISLGDGLSVPAYGSSVVLRHALAGAIHGSQTQLGAGLVLGSAFSNHASALARSTSMPMPLSYMKPRLVCAPAIPASAAFWYQATAFG